MKKPKRKANPTIDQYLEDILVNRILPSISQTQMEAVEKYVNGGVRGIKKDVEDIKIHLTKQDEALKILSDKVEPIDKTRKNFEWLGSFGKSIVIVILLVTALLGSIIYLKDFFAGKPILPTAPKITISS